MLLADPTELRFGTRLPDALQAEATPCPRLEEWTGADLLVSPLRLPFASETLLRRHVEAGVLVQRKTGGDLPASITGGRLTASLQKMLTWTRRPWLAFVGRLENRSGRGYVDGRESLSYLALTGALDYWQLRGGYLTFLDDDAAFTAWIHSWPSRLEALAQHPDKVVTRQPAQALYAEPRLSFLLSVPGLGPEKARALLEAGGTLVKALELLTSERGTAVPGIGAGTVQAARDWLGIGVGARLAEVGPEVEVLGQLMSRLPEGNQESDMLLYAQLADWLELPCTGYKGRGGWKKWAEDFAKIQEKGDRT